MKKLRTFTLIVLGFLIALSVVGYWYVQTLKPVYDGELSMEGLEANVEVHYDTYGIPHIFANSNEDAFQALGYAHAQDRLFQMEMLRRVGSGRLSEVFGPDMVNADRFFRVSGIADHCKNSASLYKSHSDSAWLQLAQAYLDGINAFVNMGPDPIEFKLAGIPKTPFTIDDLYYIVGYMTYSFDHALKTDPTANYIHAELGAEYLNDLSHDYEKWHETIDGFKDTIDGSYRNEAETLSALLSATDDAMESLPIPPFYASNAWVIGSEKSKSGKVLFANDTHIGYSQPSVWYEAHIETPDLRLYGNFLAGFPYPLIGHTDHHAWGLTMFLNDDLDLYREEIENNRVKFKGSWTDLKLLTDTIRVKGADPEIIKRQITPHGPIINSISPELKDANPVALSWTFLNFPMRALQVAYGFTFSSDVDEFYSYASQLAAPGLNVMYGDVEDNIGWWATAKLRKRPEHVNSKLILDGASGNDELLGYYDYQENPHAVNPPEGFVYSANNQSISSDSLVYPGYYYSGDRARVIKTALNAKDDWDMETVQDLALYNRNPTYPKNTQRLLNHVEATNSSEEAVIEIMESWSGSHDTADVAPTIYYRWLYHTLQLGMEDELGERLFNQFMGIFLQKRSVPRLLQNDSSIWWDNIQTPEKELLGDIANQAFHRSVEELISSMGTDPTQWKWGKVHILTHEHQFAKATPTLGEFLNVGPFAVNGGDEVVNKQSFYLDGGDTLHVKAGPAMRIVLDFANVENSVSVNPTGQSGNPLSNHYQDQAQLFAKEQFRLQMMNREAIETSAQNVLLIHPK